MAVCKMLVDSLGERGKQLNYAEIEALINSNYQELMRCTNQCLSGGVDRGKLKLAEFINNNMESQYSYSRECSGKKWLLMLASQYVFWAYNETAERGQSHGRLKTWVNKFKVGKTLDEQVVKSLTYKLVYHANDYMVRIGVFSLDKLCQLDPNNFVFDTSGWNADE